MNEWIVLAIILAAVGGAAFYLFYWRKRIRLSGTDYDNINAKGIPRPKLKFKYTSPNSVKVYSTVETPSRVLDFIDAGIRQTINRHKKAYPTWKRGMNLDEWRVLIVNPMATNEINEPGAPALKVKGIQTAGTGIGIEFKEYADREDQYIVIPHQAVKQWIFSQYLMNTVAHEAEHLLEFVNDHEIFTRWNANDIHPRPFDRCGTDPSLPC